MVLKKPKAKSKGWNIKNEMYYPNEKLLSCVIIFLWEVMYVRFYNWDRPLDLVPVVYDLTELIIEASLQTKDYSTFDTHITHKTFVQWMLISFVWLYMFKCDVYTQLLVDQTQKVFWVFYMFLKVFLCFRVLSFCSNCIFHVFHQKLLQRHFREKLATKLFPQKWVKAKYENTKFK